MYPARSALALLGATIGFLATAADWHQDFHLRDNMRIYHFPAELINYPVEFPPKTVRSGQLQLQARHIKPPQSVPFQLSEVQIKDGFLILAVVSFRSDLPKRGTRTFRLQHAPGAKTAAISKVSLLPLGDDVAVLAANRLRIKVPTGNRFYSEPKPDGRGVCATTSNGSWEETE